MTKAEELRQKRDEKTIPHIEQYAPVWIVDEKIIEKEEAVQFNVIFQHHRYGWVNRRYRYDGFNDVLYHKGQRTIKEEDTLEFQEQEPYVSRTVTDIPNAYGG